MKINGINTKYFDTKNFWLSLTIHDPQNKFIAKKCNQNNIKNSSFSNNSARSYNPKYRMKLLLKSYPEIKKEYKRYM